MMRSPLLRYCWNGAGAAMHCVHALSYTCAGFLPLLALSSFVAYFQNIANFLVTKHTSALTLQAGPQTL